MSDATSRTAEEWGRVAVSLPGWEWMPGMLEHRHQLLGGWLKRRSIDSDYFNTGHEARLFDEHAWPDPDDPATEGCLIRLLGSARLARQALTAAGHYNEAHRLHIAFMLGKGIGPACIAAAAALGRWPGGDK